MLAIFVFLLFFKLLPGIWLSLLRNSLTLSGHAFKFLRVVVGGGVAGWSCVYSRGNHFLLLKQDST